MARISFESISGFKPANLTVSGWIEMPLIRPWIRASIDVGISEKDKLRKVIKLTSSNESSLVK